MSEKEIRRILAERVKMHRTLLGIRQIDLSKRAGLSKDTVAAIEQRRKSVTLYTLAGLSGALGITPSLLLTEVNL